MKPDSCIGCAGYSMGRDFSAIEGTGANGVLSVAEASGEHEQRDQLPLRPYAPAGGVEERTIRRLGMDRQSFSISNAIRCRPRNNWLENAPWEYEMLSRCRPNLRETIHSRRPRAIRALGNIALRSLAGVDGAMLGVSYLAGYVLPLAPDLEYTVGTASTPVVVSFHPSFLRHGKMAYMGQYARVLQRAVNIASGKDRDYLFAVDPRDPATWGGRRYVTHPSLDDALSLRNRIRDNPALPVAMDIETPESSSMAEDARDGFQSTEVRQIQFSIGPGEGMAFPWEPPFREIAIDILHSPNPKYGHNWDLYDHKVLRAAAAREGWRYSPVTRVFDTLDMFHHWQPDLPAHLQFCCQWINWPFPWKHLHTIEDEPWYGCVDVDADWRLGEFLVAALRREGLWDDQTYIQVHGGERVRSEPARGYIGQVWELRPILTDMELRGMPIDDQARLALADEFRVAQGALGVELAGLAEGIGLADQFVALNPELRRWFRERSVDLKRWDEALDFLAELRAERFQDGDGARYRYELREVPVAEVDAATGEPVTRRATTRWCRVYDFNPNSRNQVIAYMRLKGHRVPKDKHRENAQGENPETTQEKELRRLANQTGDTFYLKVVEYRGFTKLRGTYIDGFAPQADGCVHTTFTFDTAIAQLSSRAPNVQNFVKLKPTPTLAKALRGMVRAKPGNVLTEWDLKSCHVLTLGFLAEDRNWMRLARLDMHSFVAGHFLGLWNALEIIQEDDQSLLARFKALKANPAWKLVRDDQAKHGILGIGNGLQARGLFERYMEQFPPRECPVCHGSRHVAGARPNTVKRCLECGGTGMQSGQAIAAEVLAIARKIGPKVFAFQERTKKTAHEKRQLVSPFGHMRRFYEVFRWNPKKSGWDHGDQAEEAVAYPLSNVAHAHMREIMKELRRRGHDTRYGLFNQIHDSLLFQFPNDPAEIAQHVRDIYPVMTMHSEILRNSTAPDGLWIDVEAKIGERWSEMRELTLPKREEIDDVRQYATPVAVAPAGA
jgi:uracil-DNA glycosylase family 4